MYVFIILNVHCTRSNMEYSFLPTRNESVICFYGCRFYGIPFYRDIGSLSSLIEGINNWSGVLSA